MSISNPLHQLAAWGIKAELNGGKIRLSPATAVTDKVKELVRRNRAEIEAALTAPDSVLGGHNVLVTLPDIGDVWLTTDELAATSLDAGGLPVLLEKDIQWILQAQGHEARLERLRTIFGRRHPMTKAVLETFPGSRVTTVKEAWR